MTACVVDGVAWDVLGDFGTLPFVLDRDHLDVDTLGSRAAAAGESLGAMVLSATWRWGATRPLGPLTAPAAGRATISLLDTMRQFDPLNASSPSALFLKSGLPIRITADGAPAFTGSLRSWSHDLGTAETTLELIDAIGELGVQSGPTYAEAVAAPDSPVAGWIAGLVTDTHTLVSVILSGASLDGQRWSHVPYDAGDPWPGGREYFPAGGYVDEAVSAFATPLPAWDAGSVLEQLAPIVFAEHGTLLARRDGTVEFRGSLNPYAPAVSLTVNCGGVFLASLSTTIADDRIRNLVRIRPAVGADLLYPGPEGSIAANGRHDLASSVATLGLAPSSYWDPAGDPPGPGIPLDIYRTWANMVTDALAEPAPLTTLGTLRPRGEEVAPVVTAEYGARWLVQADEVSPPISRIVRLLGLSVKLAPSGVEADAVTEDEAA